MDEILPLIPYGASKIANNLSVIFENDEWTYYHGALPVATHAANDKRLFRMITSSFIINGGVRTALPALAANGLYHEVDECFTEFRGYYSVTHVITLLAFMALCRIKTVEKLRWQPPGELGKLLGLDRIPEVRCLRNKLSGLSNDGTAERWGELLTRKWMEDALDLAGVLYVDGHVRLYSGKEKLWVREIRKLTKSGHQTSIVSTAYSLCNMVLAVLMFARWRQENFFNYMMQHYAIDLLRDYLKEKVPAPKWLFPPNGGLLKKRSIP